MAKINTRPEGTTTQAEGSENREALSVLEFCGRYGISRSLAYQEAGRGRLVFRKVGNRTLILVSEAERWAASLPEAK